MNDTTELTTTPPKRTSLIEAMAAKASMDPAVFAKTIKATVMPSKHTDEQFAAFLMVANKYDLDPVAREVHAFPTKSGGIQAVVGIDGWAKQANKQPTYDGVEFEDHFDNEGRIASITCLIYHKDRGRPTVVTEYMAECKRNTEPWQRWPIRMLRHKAFIQCVRYAFGVSGIKDEDEVEREFDAPPVKAVTIDALKAKPVEDKAPAEQVEVSEGPWFDAVTGVEFDPEIFVTDGITKQPVRNKDGSFRVRRGRAEAAAALVAEVAQRNAENQTKPPEDQPGPTPDEIRAKLAEAEKSGSTDELAVAEDWINSMPDGRDKTELNQELVATFQRMMDLKT